MKNTENKKKRKNLSGAGRIPYTFEIEEKLVEFIKKYREIEIALSTHELIIEAQRLLPTMINNTYQVNKMWAYRFLKRNLFALRNITHTGQEMKQESKLYREDFFKNIFTTRSILNIYDNLNQIGNMDEIAIYYENIYPTTISKIGEKSVNIRSFGKDKMRITAVLTILGDGTKLPPLLVFRGKTNGPKEKNLQKIIM